MMFLGLEGLTSGSWADWVGVIATFSAVGLALWQSLCGAKKDQRLKDKRAYAKRLMKNMLYIKNSFNEIKELFIVQNHPVAQYDAQMNGSMVETGTKTKSELKRITYNLITEIETDLELAYIDKFISNPQEYDDTKKELEEMRTNLYEAIRSMIATESEFMMMASQRKGGVPHETLNAREQELFNETELCSDEGQKAIKKLEKRIKNLFY